MKLKEILEKKNKKAKDLAIEIGTDEPMISKFVNYKCLPIPKTMSNICKALDCEVSDIYEDKEVFYQNRHKKEPKSTNDFDFYNLCVRLPNEARKYLASHNLKCLGYKDKTQWILACYLELVKKIKKTVPKSNTKTATKNNLSHHYYKTKQNQCQ